MQQVIRKNNKKFCWCLLFVFCLSLEPLLCCFIYRESYSAENFGNDPSGHSICRSQKCHCIFASEYKLLLCLLSSFFPQRQVLGVWGKRKRRNTRQDTGALQDMQDRNFNVVQKCSSC